MQFRKALMFGLMATSSTLLAGGARANLVTNGSFEAFTAKGQFDTIGSGSPELPGWTIGGTVDLIRSYWQAADGKQSLDMSGNGPGSISQVLNTVAGQTYNISFALAGNPDDAAKVKHLGVTLDSSPGVSATYMFDTTGKTHTDMGWIQETIKFTATAPTSTLTFTSMDASAFGPALDSVRANIIPEPAFYQATALLGLGGVGLLRLRRRKTA